MTAAHARPAPAALFADRYRILGHLGSGGAAEVVRAVDERLERPVALKIFRADTGPEAAERFALEGRTLARLRHPGLVEVYDYGEWEERPFLVMELIEGPTLRDVLLREPLSPAAAARLGTRLASTLSFVHGHGIVHRDIKPSNILISESGTPRLADFGVARLTGDAAITRTGYVVGTPAYLAPEQIRGRRAQPAADVYALGLALLECLTGRREYGGAPLEAAAARLHRSPAVPRDLPVLLAQILQRMTLTDPQQRPSASECAEALREVTSVAGAVPTQALNLLAPSAPTPVPPPAHRRRRASLAAATVLALAALAGSTTIGAAPPAAPSAPPAPAAPAAPAGRQEPPGTSSGGPTAAPTDGAPATAPTSGTAPAVGQSAPAPASPPTAAAPRPTAPAPAEGHANGNGNRAKAGKAKKEH